MLLHRFFIQDGSLLPIAEYKSNTGIEIYEVIRIMEGAPLFMDDHLKRFYHSAWLLHLHIPVPPQDIKDWVIQLIEANGVSEGNIRFSWCFKPTGRLQAWFLPHFYPDLRMLKEGVACGLLTANRNDPNVKAVQASLRLIAENLMDRQRWYEVLLMNNEGRITEGSRSNVFFILDGQLVTAPDEDVLPGITRKKVIEIASNMGISIQYEALPVKKLSPSEAVFLTGTSPKVLPVKTIDDQQFPVDHLMVRELINGYNDLIVKEISQYRQHL
jgi:branched-chain amino acid aminotransferase